MKRLRVFVLLFVFSLSVWILPAFAADPSTEIEQLKEEVQKLLKKTEELDKKAEKKLLKDRVNLSGEARFRIMRETATTDKGFFGNNKPDKDQKYVDATSFPVRIRLNMHAEVVPDIVDFYTRLTMNKRWGARDPAPTDPFDRPNSVEASIGHDVTARFEQAYTTIKIPTINTTWYIGRLPGLDGPPSRQERSLFPRLFIDSEIDGTLLKWDAPQTALDSVELPWTKKRLWGESRKSEKVPTLSSYERKVSDKTGIILGYLKYDERKISAPDDADVYLAQAQFKVGKDTAVILSGLYMDDWHMPRPSFSGKTTYTDSQGNKLNIPDFKTPYYLAGLYADTQIFGFQVYGAGYYSQFKIPEHTWDYTKSDTKTTYSYPEDNFYGHIWYIGFNTGDIITQNQQLCVEFTKGSDSWINPFNYRGYRRKGTVLYPANNYYYYSGNDSVTVGFYPFNAEVWDIYYDYYFRQKTRFRLGLIDFKYSEHEKLILGSSKYQHDWWPYFEVNISF